MYFVRMSQACTQGLEDALSSDWAAGSWLTQITAKGNSLAGTGFSLLLFPVDLVWSIPRAILTKVPLLNLAYLGPVYLVWFLLFAPVLVTSLIWRGLPLARLMLIPLGLPLAVMGEGFTTVAFMGGPLQDGALKLHKRYLFSTWPLTADFSDNPHVTSAHLSILGGR
jgi:hypothetical protein